MTYSSHTLDVYGADLYLATTKAEWRSFARCVGAIDKMVPEAAGSSTFATWVPNDGGLHVPTIVLWLDLQAHRTSAQVVNTIAHEAAHAAGQLLDHVSHKVKGTDEPSAYLIGWLAEWMWSEAGAQYVETLAS